LEHSKSKHNWVHFIKTLQTAFDDAVTHISGLFTVTFILNTCGFGCKWASQWIILGNITHLGCPLHWYHHLWHYCNIYRLQFNYMWSVLGRFLFFVTSFYIVTWDSNPRPCDCQASILQLSQTEVQHVVEYRRALYIKCIVCCYSLV
jgi:hypothetical protein